MAVNKSMNADHPAMIEFRRAIAQYKEDLANTENKRVTSKSMGERFGFRENAHYNRLENGILIPSMDTFLDMLDTMGVEMKLLKK